MTDNLPQSLKNTLSCYKFADDGTLAVSHMDIRKCYELMQNLCDFLSIWCIENKLAINCDVNKTEAIILQTKNTSSQLMIPPELIISNQKIRYVKQTRVLGLIIDDELRFKQHAYQKIKESNKKWGLLTKTTNRNHGLNVRSLTLLLKTTVLTKLHYAAPLWLDKNMDVFKSFWNKVIMKISGAMLNPHRELTELVLHLPPLEIQLETQTVKFLCKTLTSKDFMTSILLQIDGAPQSELHKQLTTIKRFLIWKENCNGRRGVRDCDLLDPAYQQLAQYSKEEMLKYQQKIWTDRIINRSQIRSHSSTNDEKVQNIAKRIRNSEVILDKNNFLFNHNTTKGEDSYIMDYMHGSSLIFGNIRSTIDKDMEEDFCYFCNNTNDSPGHQLLGCTEVADLTHDKLQQQIDGTQQYVEEIVLPKDKTLQRIFIERIIFLKGQHEFLEEE